MSSTKTDGSMSCAADCISRRVFMTRLAALSGIAALLPYVARADQASSSDSPNSPRSSSGKWMPIGPAGKVKQGDFSQADCGEDTVYVTRLQDNSVLAMSAVCTHLGCDVSWDLKSMQFECPCHGGRYDSTGKNISGPPKRPLQRYDTRIDDSGVIQVWIPVS